MLQAKNPYDGVHDRRARQPKVKYDPSISFGNILSIATVIISLGIAYGQYQRDQTQQDGRIGTLEKERVQDRQDVKESLISIQKTLDITQLQIQQMRETVAVINSKVGSRSLEKQ